MRGLYVVRFSRLWKNCTDTFLRAARGLSYKETINCMTYPNVTTNISTICTLSIDLNLKQHLKVLRNGVRLRPSPIKIGKKHVFKLSASSLARRLVLAVRHVARRRRRLRRAQRVVLAARRGLRSCSLARPLAVPHASKNNAYTFERRLAQDMRRTIGRSDGRQV